MAYRFGLCEERSDWYPTHPPNRVRHFTVQYAQVGLQHRGRFTGYAHDYNGGGSWLKVWFLDGHQFECKEFDPGSKFVHDIAREVIDDKYPGLTSQIDAVIKQHIIWRDGVPYARPLTRKKQEDVPEGHLMASGRLTPVGVGNSNFEEEAAGYEPLIVLSRNQVIPLRKYEAMQAEIIAHEDAQHDDE